MLTPILDTASRDQKFLTTAAVDDRLRGRSVAIGPCMSVLSDSLTAATPFQRVRQERDRYVAFAFAAADLLIEINADGTIIGAAGAAQAILGTDIGGLPGQSILDLIASYARPLARRLLQRVRSHFRVGPLVLAVVRSDGAVTTTLFGACCLPNRDDSVFCSISVVPEPLCLVDRSRDTATGLLAAEALSTTVRRLSADNGAPREFRLVRLDGLSGAVQRLPKDQGHLLMQEVGGALRAASINGDAAGRLTEDAFGILTEAVIGQGDDDALTADLTEAIHQSGIPDGHIGPRILRIDLDLSGLNGKDAGNAMSYAVDRFVKSLRGGDFDIGQLRDGFGKAMKEAVTRISDIRRMLSQERLSLVYQPILHLATRRVHHYEALTRFSDGAETAATILFSEDAGLIAELDLTVCRQAIKALEHTEASVAVNLSGKSVQSDAFRRALGQLVVQLGANRPRLLFELTESAAIRNEPAAAAFLSELRRTGHPMCLDDFGAGAAAYGYLRHFDVDFIKIDGPFLKAAVNRGRERALIRSICALCQELRCNVIGEMIEDETTAALAADLGIVFGQGWLFGKPLDELPGRVRPMRRKGPVETWE